MLFFWNVTGLNDPRKQRRLMLALKKFHGNVICLLKTHVKQENFFSITDHILPGWICIANYDHALLGRIWVFHESNVKMECFSMSAQVVHCHSYSLVHKKYFLLSVIYGPNSSYERKVLWEDLRVIKANMIEVPWLVCGDFNTELSMPERFDYFEGMVCTQSSLDFRHCLDEVELADMPYTRSFLTWSNMKSSGYLAQKLDRFLVNDS